MDNSVAAIVLAAGKGTRMKAPPTKNKVVFELGNKPIVKHTYEMLKKAGIKHIVVVIGYACESVKKALGEEVIYAVQDNPQGTAHAVQVALPFVDSECETVISMYGDDSAFYSTSLINRLYDEHVANNADLTVVTLEKSDPTGLGRIVRDDKSKIVAIVEEKNATASEKLINEINTGLYCFSKEFITEAINKVERNSISGEYYLTDVVAYAVSHGFTVHGLKWPSDDIWFGVNTPEQLVEAEVRMRQKQTLLVP